MKRIYLGFLFILVSVLTCNAQDVSQFRVTHASKADYVECGWWDWSDWSSCDFIIIKDLKKNMIDFHAGDESTYNFTILSNGQQTVSDTLTSYDYNCINDENEPCTISYKKRGEEIHIVVIYPDDVAYTYNCISND